MMSGREDIRQRLVVGPIGELPPGSRRIVDTRRGSVGVFNVNGRFVALKNVCPHANAPLCLGHVSGTVEIEANEARWVRDGEVLRCPWHQWEFDLLTGRTLEGDYRVQTFDVMVEDGVVVVHV